MKSAVDRSNVIEILEIVVHNRNNEKYNQYIVEVGLTLVVHN